MPLYLKGVRAPLFAAQIDPTEALRSMIGTKIAVVYDGIIAAWDNKAAIAGFHKLFDILAIYETDGKDRNRLIEIRNALATRFSQL